MLGQPVEPIALAGDGDDKTWLFGIRLDLAAQSPDDHVDAAVERLEAPARHRLEQRVATEDAPGVATKKRSSANSPRVSGIASPDSRESVKASRSRTRPAKRMRRAASRGGSILSDSGSSRMDGRAIGTCVDYNSRPRLFTSRLPRRHLPFTQLIYHRNSYRQNTYFTRSSSVMGVQNSGWQSAGARQVEDLSNIWTFSGGAPISRASLLATASPSAAQAQFGGMNQIISGPVAARSKATAGRSRSRKPEASPAARTASTPSPSRSRS